MGDGFGLVVVVVVCLHRKIRLTQLWVELSVAKKLSEKGQNLILKTLDLYLEH